jgi:O-antigen/teichoic acid export membrane protein
MRPDGTLSGSPRPGTDVVGGVLGSSLVVAAQAVGQFALLAILARLLTPADFGVVGASLIVTGIARTFTEGLVGPAVTQRQTLRAEHVRTAFALSVFTGVAAMLLIMASAPTFAAWFRIPALGPIARGLSLVFLIQSLAVVPLSLLQRELRFRELAKIEMASFLVGFAVVGVALALLHAGPWALVGAHVGQNAVKAALLLRLRPHERSLRVDRRAARDLLSFGGGHTVAKALNHVALQGDYVVVGRWLSAAALGVYGRAYELAATPAILLGTVLDYVLFPKMSSFQDDRSRLRRSYLVATSLSSTLMTPVLVLAVVLAPEVVAVVLGSGWEAVVVPLQVLACGLLWRTAYKLSDSLAKAAGAVAPRAWRQGVYAALVVSGALVGSRWGVTGVAIAVLIAILVNYLLMASLSLRIVALSWPDFARAHVRGVLMALTIGSVAVVISETLRGLGAADALVLLAAGGGALIPLLLLAVTGPRWVMGDDLRWLLARISVLVRLDRRSSDVVPGSRPRS